jgi:hypothetical protein
MPPHSSRARVGVAFGGAVLAIVTYVLPSPLDLSFHRDPPEALATLNYTIGAPPDVLAIEAVSDPEPVAALGRVAPQVPDWVVTGQGWFEPGGRNAGTEYLVARLAAIGLWQNEPLYVSEMWGRTGPNAVSDHHVSQVTSWAADLAVRGIQRPTPNTDLAAGRIAAALGVHNWKGGNLIVHHGGYRFQLLWRVAGHFNHVHVGARKL